MIVKDIAEYEETDSQLSKDTIFKLHMEIEELKVLCDKYEEVIIKFKNQIEEERKNYLVIIGNFIDKVRELKGVDKK